MYLKTPEGMVYVDHYTTKAKSKGDVLYLHGLGGDCKAWVFMKQATVDVGYNYVAIDLPGHGLSYRPNSKFNFNENIEVLSLILEKLKINNPIIVGHCMGGLVALAYAYRFQNSVLALVLINSGYKLAEAAQLIKIFKFLIPFVPTNHINRHIIHDTFIGTTDISIRRLVSDIGHVGLRYYITIFTALTRCNFKEKLKYITIPTLVIGGKYDIIYPRESQIDLAIHLPNALLEFIDTNHISIINAREQVSRLIFNYITSHCARN